MEKSIDSINPSYYNNGAVSCIDAMEAAMGTIATAHFCQGNAFKYLWRAGCKPGNPTVQDLKKAEWYTHKAIELIEKIEQNENQRD